MVPVIVILLLLLLVALSHLVGTFCDSHPRVILSKGFSATPSSKVDTFHSLLIDPPGNFSLGFLRVNHTGLSLAVLHVPSSQPVWTAGLGLSLPWSDHTELRFDGSLVLSDSSSGKVYWSASAAGDRTLLLNNSNLQIQRITGMTDGSYEVVWQSFDFPTDTLVEGQNFTSGMSLTSSKGLYSMRLGNDFIGLYAKFSGGDLGSQMFWKHKALEVKAEIVADGGPIFVRVEPDGYLAMYQNDTVPVDLEAFSTFHRSISTFRLLRLEPDGNLKAYYWSGKSWIVDYQAINEFCELPSACGPHGLCNPRGGGCSCLDNQSDRRSGPCSSPISADLCKGANQFKILRTRSIELPYKQLMGYQIMSSLEDCEHTCASNCSCWGTVYNNESRFCYPLYYPVQTLLSVRDDNKVGYFKIVSPGRHSEKNHNSRDRAWVLIWALTGAVLVGVFGLAVYRVWSRRRVRKGYTGEENGASPGPYKDLSSASFRSIEFEFELSTERR